MRWAAVEFSNFLSKPFSYLSSRLFDKSGFWGLKMCVSIINNQLSRCVGLISPYVLLMCRPPELAYKYGNLSEGVCKLGYAAAKMTAIYPKWEGLPFIFFGGRGAGGVVYTSSQNSTEINWMSPSVFYLNVRSRLLQTSVRSPHTISGVLQTNHFNCMSAREQPKTKYSSIPRCMMSLLQPPSPWGFWVRYREAPAFLCNLPQFQSCFYHHLPHHKNLTVSLWSSCYTKEPLSSEHKVSHLSPSPSPRALESFTMNHTNQLPVYHAMTHYELPGTQPTLSAESSTALPDVSGSFDSEALCAAHLSSMYRTLSY